MRQLNEIPIMSQDLRDAYNILKAAIERGEVASTPSQPKPDYSSMSLEEFERLQREQQLEQLKPITHT